MSRDVENIEFIRARQDKILDDLTSSVSHMKSIATDTGKELHTHFEILEDLDEDVERAQTNISRARSKLERVKILTKKNGSCLLIGLLCVLIIVFISLFFLI
jgi:archaellum component FlaC